MMGQGRYWTVVQSSPAGALAVVDASNARRLARVLRIRTGVCLGRGSECLSGLSPALVAVARNRAVVSAGAN